MTEEEALIELEKELAALEEHVVNRVSVQEPEPEPATVVVEAPKPRAKKSKKVAVAVEPEPERHPTGWSPEPTEAPDPKKAGIAAQLYGAAKLRAKRGR